jgi:hypothetical protein
MIATAQLLGREADAIHALLIKRADELVGCTECAPEEAELSTLAVVIDAYEAKRWPSGKAAGVPDQLVVGGKKIVDMPPYEIVRTKG